MMKKLCCAVDAEGKGGTWFYDDIAERQAAGWARVIDVRLDFIVAGLESRIVVGVKLFQIHVTPSAHTKINTSFPSPHHYQLSS